MPTTHRDAGAAAATVSFLGPPPSGLPAGRTAEEDDGGDAPDECVRRAPAVSRFGHGDTARCDGSRRGTGRGGPWPRGVRPVLTRCRRGRVTGARSRRRGAA